MLSGPAINTTVTLDAVGWHEPLRTRVEDLDDEVVVAAPVDGTDDHEPSLGASLTLRWLGGAGPMTVPVTLVAKELRRVSMWRLKPEGNVVIDQRRHHVRANTLLSMALHVADGTIPGHLVDLSEGGLLFASRPGRPLDVGATGEVEFCLLDQRFRLDAEVVRTDHDGDRVVAACRFTAVHPGDEDRIRRAVFGLQARARRRG